MLQVINPIVVGGAVALAIFVGVIVFLMLGRRIGLRAIARDGIAGTPNISSLEAAVFGLLGLLIAFTFSGALSRFDVRRAQAVDEANAIGTAYLRFAQEETGLFHTAFAIPDETRGEPVPAKAGNSGLNPFQLLGAALDSLVEAGVLPAERRPGAEYLAWSAVRGIAMLLTEGPLRRLTSAERDAIGQRLLDMVEKGL